MRIKELKENEPLKVVEASYLYENTPNIFEKNSKPDINEMKMIQTRIFTDGKIIKESEEVSENIKEYYIGKKKYKHPVDVLKTKNVYFKNYSYIIQYIIAKEWKYVGNVAGWFNTVKDVSIYLEDAKDKTALKEAKRVMKAIEKRNSEADYSSIHRVLFSPTKGLKKYDSEEISKNIYSLKMKKI